MLAADQMINVVIHYRPNTTDGAEAKIGDLIRVTCYNVTAVSCILTACLA